MTVTTAPQRPTVAARRFGYGVAITINAVLLYAINVFPSWEVVPFLTADTTQVLGWVNASIVAGIIANSLYLLVDRRWVKALGEAIVTLVGLTALVRLWLVFPFSFDGEGLPWADIARWVLAIGMVGSVIGLVTNVVALAHARPSRGRRPSATEESG